MAIEIAHNGNVDRDDIVRDFEARSLPPPLEIIHGDCLLSDVRTHARNAIGGGAFVVATSNAFATTDTLRGGCRKARDARLFNLRLRPCPQSLAMLL